jgi:hypothetical protein
LSIRLIFLQGLLYTIIATLTPAAGMLATNTELTNRAIMALVITCVISGATAMKAFLSTSFSQIEKPTNGEPTP